MATQTQSGPLLLDSRETARLLDVHVKTLQRLSANGSFPRGIKVGRLRKWPADAVQRWIDQQTTTEAK
jgi:excisionase family DNA binding protein